MSRSRDIGDMTNRSHNSSNDNLTTGRYGLTSRLGSSREYGLSNLGSTSSILDSTSNYSNRYTSPSDSSSRYGSRTSTSSYQSPSSTPSYTSSTSSRDRDTTTTATRRSSRTPHLPASFSLSDASSKYYDVQLIKGQLTTTLFFSFLLFSLSSNLLIVTIIKVCTAAVTQDGLETN